MRQGMTIHSMHKLIMEISNGLLPQEVPTLLRLLSEKMEPSTLVPMTILFMRYIPMEISNGVILQMESLSLLQPLTRTEPFISEPGEMTLLPLESMHLILMAPSSGVMDCL